MSVLLYKIIALQMMPLYMHMCQLQGKFKEVFSVQVSVEYGYLVASDWICGCDKSWANEIFRFGYLKQDT